MSKSPGVRFMRRNVPPLPGKPANGENTRENTFINHAFGDINPYTELQKSELISVYYCNLINIIIVFPKNIYEGGKVPDFLCEIRTPLYMFLTQFRIFSKSLQIFFTPPHREKKRETTIFESYGFNYILEIVYIYILITLLRSDRQTCTGI